MRTEIERPNYGVEMALRADPAGDADPAYLEGQAPIVHIDGHAPTLPTTVADFWDHNLARTLFAAAGVQLGFSSSSAADTAAGANARTMRAWLVKPDLTIVTEDINLNGQTKVNAAGAAHIACLRMRVLTLGANPSNAGDIYCYDATDTVTAGVPQTAAKIAGRMGVGYNLTRHGWYVVPKGRKALLISYRFTTMDATATAKYGRGLLYFQPNGGVMQILPLGQFTSSSVPEGFKPIRPKVFDEGTHILLRANMNAAGDASVFAELLVVPK